MNLSFRKGQHGMKPSATRASAAEFQSAAKAFEPHLNATNTGTKTKRSAHLRQRIEPAAIVRDDDVQPPSYVPQCHGYGRG